MGNFLASLIVLLAILGCVNVDEDIISMAGEECAAMLEKERPKIVAELRAECALMLATTLNECSDMMSGAIDDMQSWCSVETARLLTETKDNLLRGIGCVPDSSDFGWDCTEANICIAGN